jgi:hypothetical protein
MTAVRARGMGVCVFKVRVRSTRLDDETAVALRDTTTVYDLAIDFSKPPEVITAGLEALIQEGIDSGRWARRKGNTEPDSAT